MPWEIFPILGESGMTLIAMRLDNSGWVIAPVAIAMASLISPHVLPDLMTFSISVVRHLQSTS